MTIVNPYTFLLDIANYAALFKQWQPTTLDEWLALLDEHYSDEFIEEEARAYYGKQNER